MTNILVAYDQNRAIGANNDLPWKRSLPGDLKMFKKLTLGKSVVMGRKTFESIPPHLRPLPGRENIVLSRDPNLDIEGVICVNSLAAALSAATKEVFVIGGAQVFEEALPVTNSIYATEIKATFPDVDTYFPEIDHNEWQAYYRVHNSRTDDGDQYDYDFVKYDRV
jgi:dihydrofolate reductase